jgi:hypothetical protein
MWISPVYSQHGSLVVTLKAEMCRELELERGSHVMFEKVPGKQAVTMCKLSAIMGDSHGDSESTDRKGSAGKARAKVQHGRRKAGRSGGVNSKNRATGSGWGASAGR